MQHGVYIHVGEGGGRERKGERRKDRDGLMPGMTKSVHQLINHEVFFSMLFYSILSLSLSGFNFKHSMLNHSILKPYMEAKSSILFYSIQATLSIY